MALPAAVRQNGAMLPESIHGHALLNYIIDQSEPVKVETLRDWAHAIHGKQARYHTCSAKDLSLDDILSFFQTRNKITIEGGAITAAVSHVCSHEHGHDHTDHGGHH